MRYSLNERSSAYPTHLSWICATIIIFIAHIYLLAANLQTLIKQQDYDRKINELTKSPSNFDGPGIHHSDKYFSNSYDCRRVISRQTFTKN